MTEQKPDYKDSLNLPKTDFPMRAGLPGREPKWLERWERIGVYDRLRQKTGRKPFVLHDGPPYANGHLHIGHALNKILKDMVVRSQQMMGRDSRYVPGWDCHGLPIEWKIEEEYRSRGSSKDEVSIVELRQECRKFATTWIDIQREEFKRLGVIGNWEDPYLTMDYHAEAVIAAEFQKFLMNGTLYQGSKPVMWSPVEKTALAEAEVEYHEHQSDTVWVRFPILEVSGQKSRDLGAKAKDSRRAKPEEKQKDEPDPDFGSLAKELEGASVLIWTTTPWTLPQNRAVCHGRESGIEYALYEVEKAPEDNWAKPGDRLIMARKLAESVQEAARIESMRETRTLSGKELNSLVMAHPFRDLKDSEGEWGFDVPMLPGDHVTDEAGTGFVHIAPSHGDEDYQVGLAHGLVMTHNVLEDGSFREDLPVFGGAVIITPQGKGGDANKRVIEKLEETGALVARGRLKHSYPHSWRSKAPLIFRNTPQWFAAIDRPVGDDANEFGETIRQRALECINSRVEWTPKTGRNRLRSMIESRPDWVLSRQRAWGVPLTCFTKKGAKQDDPDFLLRDERVNARIIEAFEEEGADVWYAEGAKQRFLGNDYSQDEWEQVFDILDVWFDSGSTHAFVLRDRDDGTEDGIADLYLEGTDQHRGWFHSSILQACGTAGRAPYRGVLTHGFTLDEKGMKMSKSVGNTVAPENVIKQYGADILRLWVAQSDYTVDLRIGPEILKGTSDSYRRLRNTLRFMLGNLTGFSEAERVEPGEMPDLERWVLHRLEALDRAAREGYAKYDFQGVYQTLFNFATGDLSSFYFDIRKDALYCDAEDGLTRKAARTVLDLLFHRLVTWLAPILVFTMEDVWLDRYPGDESSVHLLDFPETPRAWRDDALEAKWAAVKKARRVVTSALEIQRQEKTIGSSLEAAPVVYVSDSEVAEALKDLDFADICITSGIAIEEREAPAEAFRMPDIEGIGVLFKMAEGQKCERCWKIQESVGSHEHPATCKRCSEALSRRGQS